MLRTLTCVILILGFFGITGAGVLPPPLWTGLTTANLATTQTYTFNNGNVYTDVVFSVSKGRVVSQSQNGTTYSVSIEWIATGSGSIAFQYDYDVLPTGGTYNVTVTGVTPPTPNATAFSNTQSCNSTTVTYTGAPSSSYAYRWYWQTSATGTSTTNFGSPYTITSTTTLYLRARQIYSPFTWSTASQSVGSITVLTPPTVPATATDKYVIKTGSGSVALSVSSVSGADSYRWFDVSTGGTAISGAITTSYSPVVSATKSFYVESVKGTSGVGCPSTTRKQVTAYIYPEPIISSTNNGNISMGEDVTLSVTNFTYNSYQWLKNSVAVPGATASTHVVSERGDYKVQVTKTGATMFETPAARQVTAGLDAMNMNYVASNTVLKEGVTDIEDIENLGINDKSQTVQYFDELSRPLQSVTTQGSPTRKDIVQPLSYDQFGRETIKYLPYTAEANGYFKAAPLGLTPGGYQSSPQYAFYNGADETIATDQKPFAVSVLENSPLGRVIKQGSPGQAWQPDSDATYSSTDHTIKNRYEFNSAAEVLAWTYTLPAGVNDMGRPSAGTAASPVYYGAKQLSKNKTKDEQGSEVITYTDKKGRMLLKRVQAGTSTTINDANYASTYYIYDKFDNLVCVIPPEAVVRLATEYHQAAATSATKESFLKRWAFRYRYDSRRRMIQKQVPGAGQVFMVYDSRDRLVLTQDSVQRGGSKKYWSFTKYDQLNRPILTGIKDTAALLTQPVMQSTVNAHYAKAWTKLYETFIGTTTGNVHGYTNKSYPVFTGPTTTNDLNRYLSVTYYDNYNFKSVILDSVNYSFQGNHLTGQETKNFKRLAGQVTGMKIKVLDGGVAGGTTWLKTINYYDDDYRVIQSVSDNHKQGRDRITNVYDFTGKTVRTKTTHSKPPATNHVTRSFFYDHAGRLLETWHRINSEDSILLVKNNYNELGQLVDKKLHSTVASASDAKQSVDYRYNIRGWLTGINDGPNSNGLFSFELKYNNPTATGGAAQFNGNISETIWKTAGNTPSSYSYTYDAMNRLTVATYVNEAHSGRFTEQIKDGTNSGYDLNGNIQKLQRYGKLSASTFGLIDNLTYTYISGNQLNKVDDAVPRVVEQDGFKELVKATNEYLYDGNGNMYRDDNKGITLIKYNTLNLPSVVKKSGADSIVYTYDASGIKLRQQVYGAKPKVTDYLGEYIYENDTLRFLNHEEGRILPDTDSEAERPWEYQYHLKDHLGNARVTFSEKSNTTEYLATMERTPSSIETEENGEFQNMINSRKRATKNHTPGTGKNYSYRLRGFTNEIIGPAKSLAVQAGDRIDMEVFARYDSLTTANSSVNTLLSALISAFTLSTSGGGIHGEGAYNAFSGQFSAGPIFNEDDYDDSAPRAYINYLLFDENFVLKDFGFDQISTGALTAHEYLSLSVTAEQAGYLYIYLSNEHNKIVNVYFDDFKVLHHTSVEQIDDYYPFGLTFNSYQRENSVKNKMVKFQGQEHIDDLDLGWDSFKWRNHMPEIGRFFNVDPLADKYVYNSPYAFSENHVVAHRELEGLEKVLAIFYHGGPTGGGKATTPEKAGPTGDIYKSTQAFAEGSGRDFQGIIIAPGATSASGVDTGEQFVNSNYSDGDQIVIYGYSYGGDNAMDLATSLGETGVPVNTVVTVDGSDGPLQNSTVNSTVSDNVDFNLNVYQTGDSGLPSSSSSSSLSSSGCPSSAASGLTSSSDSGSSNSPGSNGGPNKRAQGNTNSVVVNKNVSGPGVTHGNIQQKNQNTIQNAINKRVHDYVPK